MDRAVSPSGRVALLPWGTPLEVFLDPLGRTLDDFCDRMAGGWLFGYAEALQAAGAEPVLVVSSRAVHRPTTREHAPTGTPVTVLPAPRTARPARPGLRADVGAYRSALPPGLLDVLRQCDAVLVQEYEEPRADLLAWWGRRHRVPVLASFQGGAPPWYPAPVQRLARGPSLRRLAGLLVGSAEEAERLVRDRGADRARVHRVVNPVDLRAWAPRDRAAARRRLGLPAGARVVAWHGRVDLHTKGLDLLLEAWSAVRSRRPHDDLRLLLVGGGQDEPALRRLLDLSGGAAAGVQWLAEYAAADQVAERLAACDVWVSASRREGFAVAPLEAMASGRPVVLTDVAGAEELLGRSGAHGGALVPRDSAEALATALLAVLDDPRREDLGRAARQRVEQEFAPAAVARQLAAALEAGQEAARARSSSSRSGSSSSSRSTATEARTSPSADASATASGRVQTKRR